MKMTRAAARISGLVQGVNFRYFTFRTAQANGVTGWVRNCPDGTVEAVFEGPEANVKTVIDWCRQGPGSARVDRVDIDWQDYRGEFPDFQVVR